MARTYYSAIEALESRIAPAGVITATLEGGTLVIEGDGEDNQLTITQISDSLILTSSSGLIELDLPGNSDPAPAASVTISDFAGGLVVNLGDGNDNLAIDDIILAKSLTIDTGSGGDNVTLGDAQVGGNVKITGGDGVTSINIASLNAKGKLVITTGNGADSIQAGYVSAKSMNVSLGDGDDVFVANGLQVRGALKVDAGDGGNTVTLGALALDVRGKVSVIHGKDSAPDITQIVGTYGRVGSLVIENGDAAATTNIVSIIFESGAIKVVNGESGGVVTLASQFANLKSFTMTGGAGADTLNVASPNLSVAGNLVFKAGDGNDSAFILAGGRIGGKLALDMGAAPGAQSVNVTADKSLNVKSLSVEGQSDVSNSVFLSRLDVKGSLKANLSGTQNSLLIDSSVVKGAFKADFGAGNDEVHLIASTFRNAVSIKTGDGMDRVNIFANEARQTRFDKVVKVLLGAGNDSLYVGSANPEDSVTFRKKVTFDGGEGDDLNVILESAIFPNNQPRLVGFEPV